MKMLGGWEVRLHTWEKTLAAYAAAVVSEVKKVALPAVWMVWIIRSWGSSRWVAWRYVLMNTKTSSTPAGRTGQGAAQLRSHFRVSQFRCQMAHLWHNEAI